MPLAVTVAQAVRAIVHIRIKVAHQAVGMATLATFLPSSLTVISAVTAAVAQAATGPTAAKVVSHLADTSRLAHPTAPIKAMANNKAATSKVDF